MNTAWRYSRCQRMQSGVFGCAGVTHLGIGAAQKCCECVFTAWAACERTGPCDAAQVARVSACTAHRVASWQTTCEAERCARSGGRWCAQPSTPNVKFAPRCRRRRIYRSVVPPTLCTCAGGVAVRQWGRGRAGVRREALRCAAPRLPEHQVAARRREGARQRAAHRQARREAVLPGTPGGDMQSAAGRAQQRQQQQQQCGAGAQQQRGHGVRYIHAQAATPATTVSSHAVCSTRTAACAHMRQQRGLATSPLRHAPHRCGHSAHTRRERVSGVPPATLQVICTPPARPPFLLLRAVPDSSAATR